MEIKANNNYDENKNVNADLEDGNKNVNADLEELILAYVFFYIKPEYFQPVLEIVNEHHFFFRENKIVFLALKEALKQEMPLHPKTVRYLLKISDFAHLADENSPQSNGLDEYFAKLMSTVALGVYHLNIRTLCLKLKDLFLRRKIDDYSNRISKDINDVSLGTLEVLNSIESKAVEIRKDTHFATNLKTVLSISTQEYKNIENLYKNEDKGLSGISTGFSDIDKFTCGFGKSHLIILAGRPSMGKTALALNIAIKAYKRMHEKHVTRPKLDGFETDKDPAVLFFSLEMSGEELVNRVISIESKVNAFKMRSGRMKHEEMEAILASTRRVESLNILIDDTGSLDINTLKSIARRAVLTHNVELIIIDYLQLLSGGEKKRYGPREQEVSNITQGLKAIAKELKLPILALAQLSRAVESREDKRPQLSDLRESGSIEQEADLVMFIYREAYYKMRSQPKEGTELHEKWQSDMENMKTQSEIIIAKHRSGPIGTVKLFFDEDTTTFDNLDVSR